MKKLFVVAALAALAAFTTSCQHTGGVTPLPKSRSALVGEWELVQMNGTNRVTSNIHWSFTDTRLTVFKTGTNERISENEYTADWQPKPHWIDLKVEDTVGGRTYRELRQGIFEIQGDKLRVRWTIGGGGRPTTFGTKPLELKKVRKK